jgi:hypothetical protein
MFATHVQRRIAFQVRCGPLYWIYFNSEIASTVRIVTPFTVRSLSRAAAAKETRRAWSGLSIQRTCQTDFRRVQAEAAHPSMTTELQAGPPRQQCLSRPDPDRNVHFTAQEYGRYLNMPTCCLRAGGMTGPHSEQFFYAKTVRLYLIICRFILDERCRCCLNAN